MLVSSIQFVLCIRLKLSYKKFGMPWRFFLFFSVFSSVYTLSVYGCFLLHGHRNFHNQFVTDVVRFVRCVFCNRLTVAVRVLVGFDGCNSIAKAGCGHDEYFGIKQVVYSAFAWNFVFNDSAEGQIKAVATMII